MTRLATPRDVLKELSNAKNPPWWASRLGKRIENHLAKTLWKNRPMIDTQLTEKQCEAVIMEALSVVRMPDASDPVGEMLYDIKPMGRA